MQLPVWQRVREELHPQGLEVVTVALDVDPEAARSWIEQSGAQHPQLVDSAHLLDALLGIVNVPMAVWIDERGTIVRPAELCQLDTFDWSKVKIPEGLPEDVATRVTDMLEQTKRIPRVDPDRYLEALRDWVTRGAESRFALAPSEVVRRSALQPRSIAEAAAHFELGEHLHRAGHLDDARLHFREAHRLAPENWTYKRNAWELVSPGLQGPTEFYDGDWLSDIKAVSPERYYAIPDL